MDLVAWLTITSGALFLIAIGVVLWDMATNP